MQRILTFNKKMSSNQNGQFVIESVLLIALMLGLFMYGTKLAKDAQLVSLVVDGPWDKTASMIENGTWDENAQRGRNNHPNRGNRGRIFNPNGP